jgi:hypothetical protein
MRSGAADAVLETMDHCCVRWGQIHAVLGAELLARAQPIALEQGKLILADPRIETVQRWVDGRGFVDEAQTGDWVAIHWGWACDRLTVRQRANLERYTRRHIDLCNQTI